MAQRVTDQILQHPLEQPDVAVHERQIRGNLGREHHAAFARIQGEALHHVVRQLGDRKRFELRLHVARIELGQIEQVADQFAQPLALAGRRFQIVPPLGFAQPVVLEQQRIEIPAQRGKRRTQIVRHVGDEFAPRRVHHLQFVDLGADPLGHGVELGAELIDLIARPTARMRHVLGRRAEVRATQRGHRLRQPPEALGVHVERDESGQQRGNQAARHDPTGVPEHLPVGAHPQRPLALLAGEHEIQVAGSITGLPRIADRRRGKHGAPSRMPRVVAAQRIAHVGSHEFVDRREGYALGQATIGRCRMRDDASARIEPIRFHRRVDSHHGGEQPLIEPGTVDLAARGGAI